MLTIIRGLPGSGKTTFANQKFPGLLLLEADQLWLDKEGNYHHPNDPIHPYKDNRDPRLYLMTMLRVALSHHVNTVITTCSPRVHFIQTLVKIANDSNCDTQVFMINSEHGYQTIHNVPESSVQNMRDKWEAYEGETWIRAKDGKFEETLPF